MPKVLQASFWLKQVTTVQQARPGTVIAVQQARPGTSTAVQRLSLKINIFGQELNVKNVQ